MKAPIVIAATPGMARVIVDGQMHEQRHTWRQLLNIGLMFIAAGMETLAHQQDAEEER